MSAEDDAWVCTYIGIGANAVMLIAYIGTYNYIL